MTHPSQVCTVSNLPHGAARSASARRAGLASLALVFSLAAAACSGSDDSGPRELTAERRAAFEKDLDAARERMDIPGAAYAFISHGAVLEAKGLGVRNLSTSEAVDADTLFRIDSLTKGMSSALIATRVDEGAVTWDALAQSLDPEFKLSDDALSVSVTLDELLTMGTGIGSPPPFWWEYETAADVMAAASTATKTGARGLFYYNEELYATGVYLGLGAGGETRPLLDAYREELSARVFAPLGMSPADVADDPSQVGSNFATPHTLSMVEELSFKTESVPFPVGGLAPSGGVVTSVNEYAKFLIAEMQSGLGANGERIASEANMRKTQVGKTQLSAGTLARYAMGWVEDKESGRKVLWHDGGIGGYSSYALWLPEDQIGFVMFANGYNGNQLGAIARALLMKSLYGLGSFVAGSIQSQYDAYKLDLQKKVEKLRPHFTTELYAPYFGAYEHGISLAPHDDGTLWLEAPNADGRLLDASALAAPGVFLIGSGQLVGTFVQFVGGSSDDPRLEFLAGQPLKPVNIIRKLPE